MTLYRSERNRKIAGCCGGLGEKIGVDPTLLRLAYFWLTIFTALIPGLIVYLVWAIFIPSQRSAMSSTYKRLYRSRRFRMVGGVLGGWSEFTGVQLGVLRFIYVIVCIFTAFFVLLFLYLSMWMIIPKRPAGEVEIEVI